MKLGIFRMVRLLFLRWDIMNRRKRKRSEFGIGLKEEKVQNKEEMCAVRIAWKIFVMSGVLAMSFLLAGCASGNSGQVVSGILQGIGQGLSGL